jgi:hypothetical protein
MKYWLIGFIALILISCGVAPLASSLEPYEGIASSLPSLGAAPELTNDIWLNVDHPLRLADLRGKVVLLDMWTFG